MCKDPAQHTRSAIPATFSGHVSGQPLQEEEEQVALWTQNCVNKGSLGSPSLLTSSITLVSITGDTITIEALWDPGSESSFFSSDLLPFATNQRKVRFKLETLSASATQAETVNGLEASFQVQVPGGDLVSLRLLQHSGLQLRSHQLKSKILTCSKKFANKYNLDSEPCANKQSCIKKSPAKLSLILGQDLHHVAPQLVEQFRDEHGSMGVYTCSLSQKLIVAGNRMYPYTEQSARSLLSNTNSFGVATGESPASTEDDFSSLPTTALLHSALQTQFPAAVRLDKKSASLQFQEDMTEVHTEVVMSPATAETPSTAAALPTSPTSSPTPSPPSPTVRFDYRTPPAAATEGLASPRRQGLTPPPRTPSTSTASTAGLGPPPNAGLEPQVQPVYQEQGSQGDRWQRWAAGRLQQQWQWPRLCWAVHHPTLMSMMKGVIARIRKNLRKFTWKTRRRK